MPAGVQLFAKRLDQDRLAVALRSARSNAVASCGLGAARFLFESVLVAVAMIGFLVAMEFSE